MMFQMTIYILRGPFLEDIAEAEYLTGTDGYIAIEFDLCSPPDYCDTCVEKLLVDVVYEFMFGGRITCPTEQVRSSTSTLFKNLILPMINSRFLAGCALDSRVSGPEK